TTLTFHPEGDLLASHSWDGLVMLWHPAIGRPLLRLASVSDPRFSGDGRWLGLTRPGERADLLAVTPTREYGTLVSGEGAGLAGHERRTGVSATAAGPAPATVEPAPRLVRAEPRWPDPGCGDGRGGTQPDPGPGDRCGPEAAGGPSSGRGPGPQWRWSVGGEL